MPADSLAKLAGFQVRAIDIRRITGGGVQHSKYFIVDGQDVFLGSQNFDWRALSHIHELGARIRDARVASSFGDVFEWDWAAADTTTWTETAGRKAPAKMTPHVVTAPIAIARAAGDTARVWPSYSPRGFIPDSTRWDLPAVLALINGARNEVVVQLLTYAPEEYGERDTTIDAALRAAAARGVKVKLLIADWIQNNKKGLGYLQRLSTVPNVEIKLSTIPEWTRAYIPFARVEHCKYAVADGAKVWVGTANWGPGYFNQTRNIAVTIDHTGIAAQARRIFETSWTATSAAAIRAGDYPEKVRGTTPPAGKTVYGN
jgi:phosphatidylserine/phosphatidylglycerophosphate/cardiolipin synthase-like enzyme